MQLSIIDPRLHPVATQAMLDDANLRACIKMMQGGQPVERGGWPHVERLAEVEGRPAWLVDDKVNRYIVIGGLVFFERELGIVNARVRKAAIEAFGRLDAIGRAA